MHRHYSELRAILYLLHITDNYPPVHSSAQGMVAERAMQGGVSRCNGQTAGKPVMDPRSCWANLGRIMLKGEM